MKNGTIIEGGRSVGDMLHYRERVRCLPEQLEFQEFLGKGAHGAAVLVSARDEPGTPFVVKMMRHERLASAQAVARFRRELTVHLRLSQRLQVPRVVSCLGHHDDRDPARIHGTFRYYRHGNLTNLLAAGATLDTALGILVDALEGLQALHGHGYIHRDVCPANIFVEEEAGRLRGSLGDFGVGMFLEANTLITEDEVLAESQLHVGHLGFTDPSCAATEQADLHGIGATLYWLATGRATVPAPEAAGLALPAREDCRPDLGVELHDRTADVLKRLTCAARGERYGSASAARVGVAELVASATAYVPLRTAIRTSRPEESAARPMRPAWPALHRLRAGSLIKSAAAIVLVGMTLWIARASMLESAVPFAPMAQAEHRDLAELPSAQEAPAAEVGPAREETSRLLALAVSAPSETNAAELERQLRQTVEAEPSRGEFRLALARALASRGGEHDATGVLAAAPHSTTYGEEIRQLHQLLSRGGRF